VGRDAKPLPSLRLPEVAEESRVEVGEAPGGVSEGILAQISQKSVVHPLEVERGVVRDHDRPAGRVLLQPDVEPAEDIGAVERRPCGLRNRRVVLSRARRDEDPVERAPVRVGNGADLGQGAEGRTAAIGFTVDEDESHRRHVAVASPASTSGGGVHRHFSSITRCGIRPDVQVDPPAILAGVPRALLSGRPSVAARLDFESVELVDKELFKGFPDGVPRSPDFVARVKTREGKPEIVMVRVKAQTKTNPGFGRRMFEYCALLWLATDLPVLPVALFVRKRAREGIETAVWQELFESEVMRFQYRSVALARIEGEEYVERGPLEAGLSAFMRFRRDADRLELRARLLAKASAPGSAPRATRNATKSSGSSSAPRVTATSRRWLSALSLPEKGRELEIAVRTNWDVLQAATRETLGAFRAIPKVKAALAEYTDEQVLKAVQAVKQNLPVERKPIRTAEFEQLTSAPPEAPGDLPRAEDDFYARTYKPKDGLPQKVAQVVLVRKLREVRAQVGFTRIEPVTPDLQGEFDLGVQSQVLGLTTDWVPACEIHGEGVFLRLDEKTVRDWENRAAVTKRGLELLSGYDAWVEPLKNKPDSFNWPGARFYLLHSLAHLLISSISLECGYSASALRERIYCAPANAELPMAAILLSTGSAGTEGTLGGLVEQGRDLREHLGLAFDMGALCSNDPVCAGHSPEKDPAERFLEGSKAPPATGACSSPSAPASASIGTSTGPSSFRPSDTTSSLRSSPRGRESVLTMSIHRSIVGP